MGREARDVLWLTLERGDGVVSRMGVTSAHPLFVAGDGWTDAADIAPGDVVRDKDMAALTVLAVEVDPEPQIVHNLEVADAATYFAGELEAWGHNAPWTRHRKPFWDACGGKCSACGIQTDLTGPRTGPRKTRFSLDHITPRKYGGGNEPSNLRGMCCSCNSRRGAPKP
jgi:Pretoxin HINT domain/HNH endonuclease